jgi:hypothetical protein
VPKVLILVEGLSEEIFVKRTIASHLSARNVYLIPSILWTKREQKGGGFRGGVTSYDQIKRDLLNLLKDAAADRVTTLLDFYGLPDDFPGKSTLAAANARLRVAALEQAFASDINHPRFLPFLTLHEFEAWLFSEPGVVANHFGKPHLEAHLRDIAATAGGPEMINERPDSHPKQRIFQVVSSYKETSDGAVICSKIGVAAIRQNCPHFNDWLSVLESLGDVWQSAPKRSNPR